MGAHSKCSEGGGLDRHIPEHLLGVGPVRCWAQTTGPFSQLEELSGCPRDEDTRHQSGEEGAWSGPTGQVAISGQELLNHRGHRLRATPGLS